MMYCIGQDIEVAVVIGVLINSIFGPSRMFQNVTFINYDVECTIVYCI